MPKSMVISSSAVTSSGSVDSSSSGFFKRLGNDEEAAKILARITDHMNPGENTAYYARLLMYKGLKKPEELLSTDPEFVRQAFSPLSASMR